MANTPREETTPAPPASAQSGRRQRKRKPVERLAHDRLGYCLTCRVAAHARFFDYDSLADILNVSRETIKLWANCTNAWVAAANPNPEIGWNRLKATVNNRPAGADLTMHTTYGGKKDRAFRPLPQPIVPQRYDGCVIAVFAHWDVLVGPRYNNDDAIAAINLRKQRTAALRSGTSTGTR